MVDLGTQAFTLPPQLHELPVWKGGGALVGGGECYCGTFPLEWRTFLSRPFSGMCPAWGLGHGPLGGGQRSRRSGGTRLNAQEAPEYNDIARGRRRPTPAWVIYGAAQARAGVAWRAGWGGTMRPRLREDIVITNRYYYELYSTNTSGKTVKRFFKLQRVFFLDKMATQNSKKGRNGLVIFFVGYLQNELKKLTTSPHLFVCKIRLP